MNYRFSITYVVIFALLGGTLLAAHLTTKRPAEPLRKPLTSIDTELAGWRMIGGEERLSSRQLDASSYVARTYQKDGHSLGLLIAFHDSHQSAVSMHTPKNCLPGDGWEIWKSSAPSVTYDDRPVAINEYQIFKTGQRMAVLYWYQSRNRVTANEYLTKFLLVQDALLEKRSSGSLVRIVLPDQPDLVAEGFRFAQAVMAELQLCFRP